MPKIFRAMTADGDGKPKVAQTARSLGVRVPDDIFLKDNGLIDTSCGGMSVAPTWQDLPTHRIPRRLNDKLARREKDARGSDADSCWRMGTGPFARSSISEQLILIVDEMTEGGDPHGNVASHQECDIETYRTALANTQDDWAVDED